MSHHLDAARATPQSRSELLDTCLGLLKQGIESEAERDAQLDALAGLSFVFGDRTFAAIKILEQQQALRVQKHLFCVEGCTVSSLTWTCDCESFVAEFSGEEDSTNCQGDSALDPLKPCFCEHILAVALGLTRSPLFPTIPWGDVRKSTPQGSVAVAVARQSSESSTQKHCLLAYISKLSEEDTWHTVTDHRRKGHRNKENDKVKPEEPSSAKAAAKKKNRHKKRTGEKKHTDWHPEAQGQQNKNPEAGNTKGAPAAPVPPAAAPVPAAVPTIPAWTSEWKLPEKPGKPAGTQHEQTKKEMSVPQDKDAPAEIDPNGPPAPVPVPVPVPAPFVSRLLSLSEFVAQHSYQKRQQTPPRGLLNPHNMCFMNSVLQALIHSPNVLALLDQLRRQCGVQRRPELPIVNALILLVQQYTFIPPNSPNLPPLYAEQCYSEVCKNPIFEVERGRQEDAQEFLGHLLDVLESEFAPASSEAGPPVEEEEDDGWHQVTSKPRRVSVREAGAPECAVNPVRRLFGGRLSCELTRKKTRSVTFEPFQQLPLDISDDSVTTVQSAVDRFLAPETLEAGGERRVAFDKLPPVLILCFKRFTYGGGNAGKIVKPLECGDLKIWCNGDHFTYIPTAIISHHGSAPDRGHYTCTILAETQCHCDDEYIESASDPSGKDAYMAFYELKK